MTTQDQCNEDFDAGKRAAQAEINDLKAKLGQARNSLQIIRMASKTEKGKDREGLVRVLININQTTAIGLELSKS
jgi:hypothetical protein